MSDFLLESGYRANRPSIVTTLLRGSSAKYEADMNTMKQLVDECQYLSIPYVLVSVLIRHTVIQERRNNPTDKQDLLNIMLNGEDKKTGKRLSDDSIRYNVGAYMRLSTQ